MTCTAPRHGDRNAYTTCGCRCADAKEDYRLYCKRRRMGLNKPRMTDATATRRKVEALAALGWSKRYVGKRIGMNPNSVHRIGRKFPTVSVRVAEQVDKVYQELCMTVGPGPAVRGTAKAKGWVPPLAWDDIDNDPAPAKALSDERQRGIDKLDEVKVQRVMVGAYRGKLLDAERKEVVRRLHAKGLNDCEISRRTGIVERTVLRNRLSMGLPAISRWEAA